MRRRTRQSLLGAREAMTAVEFALISLPFLMLSLGTMEFGRLVWTQEALQMAATQGARCVGVRASFCASAGAYNQANAQAHVVALARGWNVSLPSGDVTVTNNSSNAACSGLAEVSISYTFQTVFPQLLTMLVGGPVLSGHACFPNQPS